MWECGLKPQHDPKGWEEFKVTPYVGVWIETRIRTAHLRSRPSLLMWECGLKHDISYSGQDQQSHSLCGSVD